MEQILRKISLFSGLEPAVLQGIASLAVTKSYPKNAIIINEGDETNTLYMIISGKVKAYLSNEDGKEVILNMMGPGEHFGELALLDPAPRSASIMTMQASKFSILSKDDFDQCLEQHPEMSKSIIAELTRAVRRLTDNVRSLALMDVYGRIAHTLLEMAVEENGVKIIKEKLTHQDIARLVGSSREMVSRIMKDLVNGGYITTKDKQIIINDRLPPAW
jgi:CRP/FNR family cyclic AMP-dependent transcriptional regulator